MTNDYPGTPERRQPASTGQIVTLVVLLVVNAVICLLAPFTVASLAFLGTVGCPECIDRSAADLPIYAVGAVVVGSVVILLVTVVLSIVAFVRNGGGLKAAGIGLAAQVGLLVVGLGLVAMVVA